jgi:lambda repressor-like predicted transcriptional regulator
MSRQFPIMPGTSAHADVRKVGGSLIVVAVPWGIVEPHERQAEENHRQSLQTLASRGGLSPCEALAVIDERPWRKMDNGIAHGILAAKVRLWTDREIDKLDVATLPNTQKEGT